MTEGTQLTFGIESESRLWTVDQMFDYPNAEWVTKVLEDHRVERKSASIQARALGDWFSMWANTPPDGGIILLGLSDDGQIEGTLNVDPKHILDLEKTGDAFCCDSRFEIKHLKVTNKDNRIDELIVIRVHYNESKVVRTSSGNAFVRRADTKKQLREDEIRELQVEKGEVSWEQEKSSLIYPDEFDLETLRFFARSVINVNKLSHVENIREILVHRKLGKTINGTFIPNKACSLLFSKDPTVEIPGSRIRFLRFDGTDEGVGEKYNAIKDVWIEGNIPKQLVSIEKVISDQLREYSRLGKDGKFSTSPEYPKPAWYEAVVNAVCHRSYGLKNSPIFVKMFDDRLVVESPGGFLPFVTPENIYDAHHPRNPHLMAALYFFNYVKCAHEGTRRMRETMQELALPDPVFSEKHSQSINFSVTLRNNVEQRKVWIDSDATKIVGELISNTLSDHERRVINYVAEFHKINVSDCVRLTNRAWDGSKRLLDKLTEKGILKHIHRTDVDRDPKAHYILNRKTANNT